MEFRSIVIKDICILNSESIGSKNAPQKIKYLDTSSITKNQIDCYQLLDSHVNQFPSRAKRKVKKATIIYSTVRPNQEHYGFFEEPEDDIIVSTGFVTIDVIDSDVDPKFLYYCITQNNITNYLHTIAVNNVSSYPSINPDDLGKINLIIPNDIHNSSVKSI